MREFVPFVLGLVEVGAVEAVARRYRSPLCWLGTAEALPEHLAVAIRDAATFGLVAIPDVGLLTLTDDGRASLPEVPRQRGAIFPR